MATETVLPKTALSESEIGEMDAHDRRDARINQLAALTATISGEGFDNFTNYGPEVQRSVLWLVHEMACEVEAFNSVAQGCIAKEQAFGGRRGQT